MAADTGRSPDDGAASERDKLDYLYREYVRLGDAIDSHLSSSFDDIKLLGAIGVLLAWPPIAKSDLFSKSSSAVLLIGFVGIVIIIGILGVRDLMKQCVIRFYLQQLGSLEHEISEKLKPTGAFSYAERWPTWEKKYQVPIIKQFQQLFIVLLALFPNVILAWQGRPWQVAVYTVTFVFVVFTFMTAFEILRRTNPDPPSDEAPERRRHFGRLVSRITRS